uniref:Odorant receptor n=1 Tax=Eucryptorrhynchus brandti TaxID=436910 RepID=A0A8F4MWY9_EUCBR|nr:odorant receptor 36 [Eucryptorrhynchus brandti]
MRESKINSRPKRKMARQLLKCCDVSFKLLRICKLFPEEGQENSFSYLVPVSAVLMLNFLQWVFNIFYIIDGLKHHYGLEVIKFGIVCIVSMCGVMWINSSCFRNRHLLIALAKAMSDFETFGKPPAFDEVNDKINFYSKLHFVYLLGGSLLYFVVFAPMQQRNCTKQTSKANITTPCSIFVPIYVPYVAYEELERPPNVYIINAMLFCLIICVYVTCGIVVWNNFEMVEYIRLRIRHLKALLLGAFQEADKVARRRIFRKSLRYHAEILRMARLADRFYGTELFLHVILTGVILGVSGFVMIESQQIDVLMVFVGWLNAIIIGCVSGQRLIDESSTIPDILYEVNWYNFEIELKKDIVFFLLRCKQPMCIRTANVIMTNTLIIEILRTAYSYFTFLSAIGQ